METINKTIEEYSIDNFRNEISGDIEETKEEAQYLGQAHRREIQEILDLVKQMATHHEDSLAQPAGEIIDQCFIEYGEHLEGLEKKDINALRKRVGELKGMQKNLARDLQDADSSKINLLRGRERIVVQNNEPRRKDDRLRQNIMANQQRFEQIKAELG